MFKPRRGGGSSTNATALTGLSPRSLAVAPSGLGNVFDSLPGVAAPSAL